MITYARILEAIQKRPKAETALDGWYRMIRANHSKNFAEMKRLFPSVDKVGKFHVFDIGTHANSYSLLCRPRSS